MISYAEIKEVFKMKWQVLRKTRTSSYTRRDNVGEFNSFEDANAYLVERFDFYGRPQVEQEKEINGVRAYACRIRSDYQETNFYIVPQGAVKGGWEK